MWYLNLILALEQKIVFWHQQVQPKSEREPLSALQIKHAEFFVCSHVCWTSEMTIRLNEDGADSRIMIIKWGSVRENPAPHCADIHKFCIKKTVSWPRFVYFEAHQDDSV